ncbi:tetratricopeptide repeat protein [Leadbetterella sp. DM7]|uniref:tetratricopeptide repeat protein n=1 Tax=Leadbetterella sp. DM7 TaxID=3235085 RepID=UPI00349E92BF
MLRQIIKPVIILLLGFHFCSAQDLELAYTYYKQGEYDKAAEIYKKLSDDKKYASLIHMDYVAVLFKLRDYDTAEKFIKTQISRYGNTISYRADLAEVYENSGRKEQAMREFDKLIDEAAGSEMKVLELMNFFYRNQKLELLVKLILKDREVTKNPYKLDTWLARTYNLLNMKDKMIEEVLSYGRRNGNPDYVKATIQDAFVTEDEIKFIETLLFTRIQNEPNETFYSEILIWWFAQKGDFSRAFIQARSLDKRLNQGGSKVFELAYQSYQSKDYKNSARMYQYIMDEYPDGELYPYARTWMIKSKEEVVKNSYPIEDEAITDLIEQYKRLIADLGNNIKTAEAMRNMALLQAFYLHDYSGAISTLEMAIRSMNNNPRFRDQCKLDMGDIYLLKDEPWESTLLYMQVEKSQKEDNLGEIARLKNAKLQYYTGQFALSKDILDILKKATSKEISNDAMQLSLLIEDNTGLDTSETALARFSKVDLLIFQNKYEESIRVLDTLYKEYNAHALADEILWLRANTLLKVNRIPEAVNDLNTIVEKYAGDILADDALFLLARVTDENLKDKQKAMELYRRVLTEFPGSIFNAQARIRFRELRGDYVN